MRTFVTIVLLGLLATPAAQAAPGLGEKVYGATVEKGVTALGIRFGEISGGHADGERALIFDLSHGFSERIYGAVFGKFVREPHESSELEALGVEGIFTLGNVESLDLHVALLAEYEMVSHETDQVAVKLLLQHEAGPFDSRLNLIAEKHLENGAPLEFGYAASADWEIGAGFRLGAAAFGDLGSTSGHEEDTEHYAGPIVKFETPHSRHGKLELEAGYLFALERGHDEADGQFRFLLEYGMEF